MSSLITWGVYDDSDVPLTNLTIGVSGMKFVDYVLRDGTSRATLPTILNLGGGQYGFLPTDEDEALGVVFLIDNGSAANINPRYVSGNCTIPTKPFAAWHLEDGAGVLWTGTTSTVGSYVSTAGARTAPSIVYAKTYLLSLTPTTADSALGVSARVDSPANAFPTHLQFSLQTPSDGTVVPTATDVSISHTMAKTVNVSGLFQVVDTVIASTNIGPAVYVYLTATSVFHHVAGAGEMQAYLDTQGAAATAGSAYYRQPTVTKAFTALADAVEFAAIINARLKALCAEQHALLAGFTGTATTTVTS